ncbi:MAG: hypothetical protein JST84_25045 [Acidobacteria bacterium]|nr:hypothetical protein [Acidobacteriota bacterium]
MPVRAQYRFDQWTADNGLPQNSIFALLKTRDGYLWMATGNGLVRFDGVRFTVFDKTNTPALPSNGSFSLYEDRDGALWFAGEKLVRYRAGEFKAFALPGETIRAVTGDESGRLWLLAKHSVWEFSQEQFVKRADPATAYSFHQYQFDRPEGFWWNGEPLRRYAHGELTTWTRASLGLTEHDDIRSIIEDAQGALWLAVYNKGIFKVVAGRVVQRYDTSNGLPNNRAVGIFKPGVAGCAAQQADLWLAGDGWLLRLKDGVLTPHPLPPTNDLLEIRTLLEDCEGNLWLGTNRHGLIRARPQIITTYSKAHGLPQSNVYPLIEDRDGQMWAGSWQGGFSRFNNGRFENYSHLRLKFPRALALDPAGRVAVGMNNGYGVWDAGRFSVVDVPALKFDIQHATTPGGLNYEPVLLFWDRAGALWLGADHVGILRHQQGAITHWRPADGPAFDAPKTLLESRDGSIWIGGYGGLAHYQNGQMTHFTAQDGLPGNTVRCLYEDADGVLWLGTYDSGLGRYADGRWTMFTTREGLYDNGVFAILEDAQGFFWMSSNRGIHRVSKRELNELAAGRLRTLTAVAYGKEDGMLNAECNGGAWPSGVRARDGKLWFPTQDGVAVIDPAKLNRTQLPPPPVQIEECLVDGVAVPLQQSVRLEPGRASFEIRYTALSFTNSDKLPFRYRLRGLDDNWVVAGTRRAVTYSYVPPGEYQFQVIAANRDGVWNTTGASITIHVLPPLWRRWWFLALCSSAVLGLGFVAYRTRVGQLERARQAQENFSRQLLSSQERERQRIAAELHDSLGQRLIVIKNLALLLLQQRQDSPQSQQQVTQISAETSRAIHEVKEISYNLRPHQLEQVGLTKTLQGLVQQVAQASGIAITAELDPLDELFTPADQINVFRIVQEGLSNIVKHSGATAAQLIILGKDEYVELTLQDNGRGLANAERGMRNTESQEPATPHAALHTPHSSGFGLKGIAERVRIMNGTYTINSTPETGTTLRINLRWQHEPTE